MFNGIIFNKGLITKIIKRPKGINIFVKSDLKLGLKDIGVSVACDGVCLTLISIKKRGAILIKRSTDKYKNLDLKKILKDLYKMEIRNLLVEGGDILTKNFLQKKLFNEFYMFRSSKKLSKNKKHVNFTSFSILNTKYNKHKINSELASDKLTIYKN